MSAVIGVTGMIAEHVRWMRLRGLSPATVALRILALSLLERHAGRPLEELSEADLDGWQGSLLVLAKASRATYAEQVKGFYRWAYQTGRLASDPSAVLEVPRRPRRVPQPISEANLARALRSLPPMVRLWLVLAAFAGLRASEIAGLRREDVRDDDDVPYLTVGVAARRERDGRLDSACRRGLSSRQVSQMGHLQPHAPPCRGRGP